MFRILREPQDDKSLLKLQDFTNSRFSENKDKCGSFIHLAFVGNRSAEPVHQPKTMESPTPLPWKDFALSIRLKILNIFFLIFHGDSDSVVFNFINYIFAGNLAINFDSRIIIF